VTWLPHGAPQQHSRSRIWTGNRQDFREGRRHPPRPPARYSQSLAFYRAEAQVDPGSHAFGTFTHPASTWLASTSVGPPTTTPSPPALLDCVQRGGAVTPCHPGHGPPMSCTYVGPRCFGPIAPSFSTREANGGNWQHGQRQRVPHAPSDEQRRDLRDRDCHLDASDQPLQEVFRVIEDRSRHPVVPAESAVRSAGGELDHPDVSFRW